MRWQLRSILTATLLVPAACGGDKAGDSGGGGRDGGTGAVDVAAAIDTTLAQPRDSAAPVTDVATATPQEAGRPETAAAVDGRDAALADAALADAASPDVAREAGPDMPGIPRPPCSPPARLDQPPQKLSETGCMDARDPKKMAAFVIPYDVASPLWSDAADKVRGMFVPAGKKIHVKDCAKEPAVCPEGAADTGKWVFPVGTVMVKSFLFDAKLVETRLFMRFDADTWVGYSYEWNQAQTDATIVPDERRKITFNTGMRTVEWSYPSRMDCMQCHTPSGGSTLGPETVQMNRLGPDGAHQIDKLDQMALFDATLSRPYQAVLPTPYDSQSGKATATTIEKRTRSYLHANCAFCHRPDGNFNKIDLRYDVPFKGTNLCDIEPTKGDVGVIGSTLFKPGKPMESVMWLRMHTLENGRMPQIGTYKLDDQGLDLVSMWVRSVATCP